MNIFVTSKTLLRNCRRFIRNAYTYYRPVNVEYRRRQRRNLALFREAFPKKTIIEELVDRSSYGSHDVSAELIQFWFASNQLYTAKPKEILDIGSHVSWLTGVGSNCRIKTIDVRSKKLLLDSEQFCLAEAQNLPFADGCLDCVTSLCSLEHFGLGAYGDSIDPYGDIKALDEIARVLCQGGHFIFTTTVTKNESYIVFNTRRVYKVDYLRTLLQKKYRMIDEKIFSMKQRKIIDEDMTSRDIGPYAFDLYLGHWKRL